MKITVPSQVGLQRHQATLQISKIEINDLSTFLVHCTVLNDVEIKKIIFRLLFPIFAGSSGNYRGKKIPKFQTYLFSIFVSREY